MESEIFRPTFAAALRENLVVCVGILVIVPVLMMARVAAHPGMSIMYAVGCGVVGALFVFLFYTVRFVLCAPKKVSISEKALLLQWRNGTETEVPWSDLTKVVVRNRWDPRSIFYLPQSTAILWEDGFSAGDCIRMWDLIEQRLLGRGVLIEKYDVQSKRIV